jgi:mono/diheme cytochrome c family protein
MKRKRDAIALALVSWLLALSCRHAQVPLPTPSPATTSAEATSVARGEYIVRTVSVCGSCHAAPGEERDPDGPLSGGMEFHNWRIGIARASNLTPDAETGLGAWSDAEIVRALRNGQHKDGRVLAPVMPYEWYHVMSDDDAFAVARYLKSQPPVRNHVKQSPNVVFKIGRMLFLRPKPARSTTAPSRTAVAEYGGYLAQHVSLCADCHTERVGLLQKPDRDRLFAGMDHPPEGFPVKPPNITAEPERGIGKWSEADFVRAMRTGVTPDGETLHPFMPWPKLKRMTDDDLHAMYVYLRALPPVR